MTTINVVGLGYIGLPTALMFADHGHQVQGVDVREDVVADLRKGHLHFQESGIQDLLNRTLANGRFDPSTVLRPADVHILCVPSPVGDDKRPNLAYVEKAARAICAVARPDDLVILESTVPPGTTRDVLAPVFAEKQVHIAHCPETIIPGNMVHELLHNDRVIGGLTPIATMRAVELYRTFVRGTIDATDATTAEFVKVAQNTYRDVNIALANELAALCRRVGTDAREMIRIANNHPRVSIHQPGAGVGGHCIPVDPWFLVGQGVDTPLIQTARAINDRRPIDLAHAVARRLAGIQNPVVAVLGVAYKPDVDDARESPTLPFIEELARQIRGVTIRCTDPHVTGWVHDILPLEIAMKGADIGIVMCPHKEYANLSTADLVMIDPVQERA